MIDVDSNARAIFYEALDRASPDERSAYLEEACGQDPQLRGRVDDLLRAHREAGNFLGGEPSVDDTIEHSPITEGPGTVIGPYKLLQQIGEGGFGVVFLAEQERPVRRRVALKIIKPGMDTRQVIARFEAERQALAMMDHPNIAKVYDAGATENGRPYFVMELVQGVPITEYCDQCNLTTRERLELFITVCQAVQHAHQKGVIHRDIKPTNVLVAIQDGQPAPKIIDFGVAKAINQQLTEHTLMTAFAQIVGTPLYMSPEQAELSPLGVDTRSDIYSLGALLYELLTSATPFDKDRLHAASYDEFRRIIREEEPPRPSARISTLAADLATTVAAHHRTDARRLRQAIAGELDWIVMKCLEKDRNRRYETPNGLARDIGRYLNDEPVQACPPSARYRFKKYLRRNKVAAAFILVLTVGFAALAVSNVQKNAALALALKNEQRAITEGTKAKAVSDLLQEMLASSNPDQTKGSQYTVRELLDNFSKGLGDQLAGEPEVESAIRSVIGKAYWRLGVYDRAELHLKKALELRRQVFGADDERVADSLVDYAWNLGEQSRHREAETYVRDALSIYRQQNSDPQRTVRALWSLQNFLIRQSRLDEAEEVASEALALAGDGQDSDYAEFPNILHGLADAKWTEGKYEDAEKWARRSVELHRRLHGNHHPETAWGLFNLGRALKGQQKFAEAEPPLRESLAIFREYYTPEHQSIQSVIPELKSVLEAKSDRAGVEALASEEAERASRSDSPGNRVRLAGLLLANRPPSAAQKQEAHRLIRRAIEAYGQVAVDDSGDLDRRANALDGYAQAIGLCAATPGFAVEVDELNRRLEAELPKLLAAFPDSGDCLWRMANIYRRWAVVLIWDSTYLPTAEGAIRESIKFHEKLALAEPNRPGVWLYLADRNIVLGYMLWRSARPDDAEAAYRRAMEIFDQHDAEIAADKSSGIPSAINIDSVWLAYFLGCTHREDKAAEFVRKAALNAKRIAEPTESALALYWTALVQVRLGDDAGYRETCAALVDVPVTAADDFTKVRTILTWCHGPAALEDLSLPVKRTEELAAHNSIDQPHLVPYVVGAALYRAGQYERAAVELEKSIAVYPSDPQRGERIINWQRLFLAMTKWQLGQRDEARQLLTEIQPAIDEELQSLSIPFNYRLTLEVLRRDAEVLIGPNEADEAVENKSRTSKEPEHPEP